MALSSFQLFVSQVQSAPEELKVRVLQVIFDLLFVYNQEFLGRSEDMVRLCKLQRCSVESRLIEFYRLNESLIFCCKLWTLMILPGLRRYCASDFASF
jgi:Nuclear condensing complex subunits, C-term domain